MNGTSMTARLQDMAAPLRTRRGLIALCAALSILILAILLWPKSADGDSAGAKGPTRILARARIEPADRVHFVSGPSGGGTIATLNVREGSRVKAGETLALLDTYDQAEAAVQIAERDMDLAALELRQVAAGAKQAEINAQRAAVSARSAELARAESQLARAHSLRDRQFLSIDALEQRELETSRSRESLAEARARLRSLTEIRPADIDVARARIEQARARLASARAERDRTVIKAPVDGTVLALYARPGGTLGTQGLLSLGNLDRIIAVGEFDEQVAPRLRVGQPVEVTLRSDGQMLRGHVAKILNSVNRADRPTTDVLNGRDARVVEAEIAFDQGQTLPRVIGGEATVTVVEQQRKRP